MKRKLFVAVMIFAVAFGILTVTEPRKEASAAIAFLFDKAKPNTILTTKKAKEIFVGGKILDLDYKIGGKKSGIKGRWTSSNPKVVEVSQNGKLKAVGNGTVTISFRYLSGGKVTSIKCKVLSRTRAKEIKLITPDDFDGTMDNGALLVFGAELSTNPKALAINPSIKHSYKPYYELFIDESCKFPAPLSLANISDKGFLLAKHDAGTIYVRVAGKLSKNSKNGVIYSTPVAVTIGKRINLKDAVIKQTALNRFDVSYEEATGITSVLLKDGKGTVIPISTVLSSDGKILTVISTKELKEKAMVTLVAGDKSETREVLFEDQRVSDIRLIGKEGAYEASLIKFDNNKGVAEIGYRLLDQFGQDVTTDFRFANKCYAVWENSVAEIKDGKISLNLLTHQFVGYNGTLKIGYGGQNNFDKTFSVKVGNIRTIGEIKIEGIFKRIENGYARVLDRNASLSVGTVIGTSGGREFNHFPESYYLLVKVKDNSGNSMAEAGVDAKKYNVAIISNTGLELDKFNTADILSSKPVTIDGETYLTFALKPAILKEGDVLFKVSVKGTKLSDTMVGWVAKTASAGNLTLSGEGFVNEDNRINFTLTNSNNVPVLKFEEVIAALGLFRTANGEAMVPLQSNVIFSANYSVFIFKKNASTGNAELFYRPNLVSLPNGMRQNIEEIKVFKDSENESKFILTVKQK